MSGKDPNKSVSERHYSADVNSLTPVYLKLDLTLHSNADGKPNEQLQRMLDRKRPWDGNGKPLSARRQTQPCNTKGPGESQPPVSADNGHHEACPCGCGFCSGKHLESLATDLVHGQINHVIVTAKFAQRYPSEYRAGIFSRLHAPLFSRPSGIDIKAVEGESLPKCTQVEVFDSNLIVVIRGTKYYLPMDSITADDFIWLSSAVFKLKAERLHIDITACGEYYIRSFDGGLHDSPSLLATMEQASFLLGAFVYGRCALTGKLFFPKPGQLQGYKNPILEAARLLQCDNEYMAVRCRYRDVFIHPTLVSSEDIRAPEPGWFDWWPHLGFPDTVLNLACRIVMVDLSGRLSYYDVPSTTSAIDPEADILLRPYMPLLEAFRAHGTKWVASEPVLCKVEMMAKVFQVLSLARSQGVEPPSHLYPLTLTSYERAEKRADFRYPLHSPRESDQLSSGLRSALLMTIPRTIDALSRASQYHSLGLMCYQLESFDEGIEYLLIAVELYSIYSTAESMAAGGIRECLTYILRCLYAMLINGRGYGWMLDKEDEEYPMWWSTLHSVFGPTLQEFTLVVQELRASKTDSYRAREAVPLCAEMLLIHLSYAILSWFEKQKDLDGITVVYQILAQLYARGVPKDDDQINRFSSVKKAKETLTVRLTPWVYRDVLDVQRRLKTEDYARNGERNPLIVQEGLMDFYVLNGETNKAMVCALAAVRMQEALWLPINERARILQKAAMIARTARAQHDVGAAMTIVRSAESVLGNRNGRPWREDEQVLKEKLLTSLDEAAQLLQASGQELERSTHRALYRAYMAVAEIRRYERTLAAQWAIAAQIRDRAAMSATDLQELKRYEKTWLVDGKEEIDKKALGQAVLFLVRECTSD